VTRGPPPGKGLKEAKQIASRLGETCENSKGRGTLYDFSIHLSSFTIAVRVRGTKMIAITAEDLVAAYPRDIARIRRVPATPVFIREIWVRTSAGTWQYFLILRDRIVEIPSELPPPEPGKSRLRGNAPGPDPKALPGIVPAAEHTYTCPFLGPPK